MEGGIGWLPAFQKADVHGPKSSLFVFQRGWLGLLTNPYRLMLISMMCDVARFNLFPFVVKIRLERDEDLAFIVLR
jgi:hypothetical protein